MPVMPYHFDQKEQAETFMRLCHERGAKSAAIVTGGTYGTAVSVDETDVETADAVYTEVTL